MLNFRDVLSLGKITVDLQAHTKGEAIDELVTLLLRAGDVSEKRKMVQALLEREALGTTAIGNGIAIPHSRSQAAKKLSLALGLSREGVNFEALDGEPVHIVFLQVAPEHSTGEHLKSLARIAGLLNQKEMRARLRSAQDAGEVLDILAGNTDQNYTE